MMLGTACGEEMDPKNMNFYQKIDYIIENMPLNWAEYNEVFNGQLNVLKPRGDKFKTSRTEDIQLPDILINDIVIREDNFGTFADFGFNSDTCHSPDYFIEKYFKGEEPESYLGDGINYYYYVLHNLRWKLELQFGYKGDKKCLIALLFKDRLYAD